MRLAKFISYITHPALITTYMLAFALWQTNSYLYYTVSAKGRLFFVGMTAVLTCIAPLISIAFLVYQKHIPDFYMEDRKDRLVPMTISAAYTFGVYYVFSNFNLPPVIMGIIGVSVIGVVTTLVITLFWKISAHMMGMAGFSGVVLALSSVLYPVSAEVIIGFFLLTGFTGYARLKLHSHSLLQVIAAWVLGYPLAYFSMLFIVNGAL